MIYIHSFTITHEVSYFIRRLPVPLRCRVCHFILDYIIPSWDVLVASVDLNVFRASRVIYITYSNHSEKPRIVHTIVYKSFKEATPLLQDL